MSLCQPDVCQPTWLLSSYLTWRMWESSIVRWPRRSVCCWVVKPSLEMAQTSASITESSRRISLFLLSISSAVCGELVHRSAGTRGRVGEYKRRERKAMLHGSCEMRCATLWRVDLQFCFYLAPNHSRSCLMTTCRGTLEESSLLSIIKKKMSKKSEKVQILMKDKRNSSKTQTF